MYASLESANMSLGLLGIVWTPRVVMAIAERLRAECSPTEDKIIASNGTSADTAGAASVFRPTAGGGAQRSGLNQAETLACPVFADVPTI